MASLSSLSSLIYSLTMGEKKYFTMKAGLMRRNKDYLLLYRLIESQVPKNALRQTFLEKSPGASFETSCKYLYKLLLDALTELRSDSDSYSRVLTDLIKATILFEKNLYEECFDKLEQVQAKARSGEMKVIELLATKLEMQYHSNLHFSFLSENELSAKQMSVQNLLNEEKKINQYNALYKLLRHRILQNGIVANPGQKEKLNDLVISELNMVAHPASENFESKKLRLLFQANYFIAIDDQDAALRIFYELNTLFEQEENILPGNINDYISMLEGVLNSLRTIRRVKDMDFFLDKLGITIQVPAYMQSAIDSIFFIYKSTQLFSRSQFPDAFHLLKRMEKTLFKKMHLLHQDRQAELSLYAVLCCFYSRHFPEALNYLEKVRPASRQYHHLPYYRVFKLVKLLIHHEMQESDLLLNEIRSVKRMNGYKEANSFLPEKILIQYIAQASAPLSKKERALLWETIRAQLEQMEKTVQENKVLTYFDLKAWLQQRLAAVSALACIILSGGYLYK